MIFADAGDSFDSFQVLPGSLRHKLEGGSIPACMPACLPAFTNR